MSDNFEVARNVRGEVWNTYYPPEANYWYNYESAEALLANPEDLKAMINNFLNVQVPRLQVLDSYANGNNYAIQHRPRRQDARKSDRRTKHDFGGFIATFQTGYLFGIPVKVSLPNDEEGQAILNDINGLNDTDELNADLGFDCSRFGRAYEVHYRDEKDNNRIKLSSPFQTFVVYDETLNYDRIAGVRILRSRSYKDEGDNVIKAHVYTVDKIYYFEGSLDGDDFKQYQEPTEHVFGAVPIIEWQNNRFRTGDYEKVISLIDNYDAAQSDSGNYLADINDAILTIKGYFDENEGTLEEMLDATVLLLKYGTAVDGSPLPVDAGYLTKQYDVAGHEAIKQRTEDDIHKFSFTPDLSDKNFSQNSSGVAMYFKMLGTDQYRAWKEQAFTKAIKERYRIISNSRAAVLEPSFDSSSIGVAFTANLPVDRWKDVDAYIRAGGDISNKSLAGLLPWIDDWDKEKQQIEDERSASLIHDYNFLGEQPRDEEQKG